MVITNWRDFRKTSRNEENLHSRTLPSISLSMYTEMDVKSLSLCLYLSLSLSLSLARSLALSCALSSNPIQLDISMLERHKSYSVSDVGPSIRTRAVLAPNPPPLNPPPPPHAPTTKLDFRPWDNSRGKNGGKLFSNKKFHKSFYRI